MLMWDVRPESNDEDGASAVEYGLLLAGVAALIIAVVFLFGGAVANLLRPRPATHVGTGSTAR